MLTVYKACACVVRRDNESHKLLAFEHPSAGKQLPKGTVEADETFEEAALRELEEESGLKLNRIGCKVGVLQRYVGGGPEEDGPLELHEWHIFMLEAPGGLPESWHHRAEGSAVEDGLVFRYFWQPIPTDDNAFHPVFHEVMAKLAAQLASA